MTPDPSRPDGDDAIGRLRGTGLFDGIDDGAVATLAAGGRSVKAGPAGPSRPGPAGGRNTPSLPGTGGRYKVG